jgi:hypothetical protein
MKRFSLLAVTLTLLAALSAAAAPKPSTATVPVFRSGYGMHSHVHGGNSGRGPGGDYGLIGYPAEAGATNREIREGYTDVKSNTQRAD